MSLEERIRQSVGNAVDEVRARMEGEVRALVQELVSSASEERQAAVANARDEALADARRDLERQIAEAEARANAEVGERLADARAHEREQTTLEVRDRMQAEAQARLQAAMAEADARLASAVAEGDERLHAALADAARVLDSSVAEARVGEREAEMARLGRLLEAVRGLDGATTLTEVLDVLGQSAARETARAALLVLRGDRLQGWKLSGFGAHDASPKNVELGLADGGIIGLAVTTTRAVTTRDGHATSPGSSVFELPSDRMGLAVPVIVGGRAVAVLYADSAAVDPHDAAVPSCWPEVIEILARHAARCLEALTAQRAAATPAPRFWVPPGTGPGVSSLPHDDDTPLAGVSG